jgi:hypothetical protein
MVFLAAVPASAQDQRLTIDVLPGHPVYHETAREAGIVMAIAITPAPGAGADLRGLCEELRVAAGLRRRHGPDLPLAVIFVVPYKGMAIEGYYLPVADEPIREVLLRGRGVPRATLGEIVARAGIPASILDEAAVEHEISCEVDEPAWLLRWEDVRPIEREQPEAVIEHAYCRFLAVHDSVLAHLNGAAFFGPAADLTARAPRVADTQESCMVRLSTLAAAD